MKMVLLTILLLTLSLAIALDRPSERRVAILKRWRTPLSQRLGIDPGVLCPNAALEAIAWRNPSCAADLEGLPELKGWFVREFGDEVAKTLAEDEERSADASDDPKGESATKPDSDRSAASDSQKSGRSSQSNRSHRKQS